MVVRFELLGSDIWAQKPKSAGQSARISRDRGNQTQGQTEFDVAVHAQQNIVTLDVAMDDAVPVQVFKTLGCFPRYCRYLPLGHQVGGDDVGEGASFHVLHDDPKVVLVEERIDVIDDVGVSRGAHDENFVDDQILLGLLVEIHLFDGDREIGSDLIGGVDATGGAAMIHR